MSNEAFVLLASAVSIAFIHTIAGPDHYLPFIALAAARGWSNLKTTGIVVLCGLGHVISSLILGLVGVSLGYAISRVSDAESIRNEIVAWLLIGFGLAYTVWGIRRAYRSREHSHNHSHGGAMHHHTHSHDVEHAHVHTEDKSKFTPWVLFIIFIFGPCEPLIPLTMYPAASGNYPELIMVFTTFALVTILTMLGLVLLGVKGIRILPFKALERHAHTLAGITILLCGVGIKFMGL